MARRRNLSDRHGSRYEGPAPWAGLLGAWLTFAAAFISPAAAGPETGFPGGYSEEIEVTASLQNVVEGNTICTVSSLGLTLRELFDRSDLVFAARVGPSEVFAVDDGAAEIRTILRVARHYKGAVRNRFLTYRHSLPVEAFGPEISEIPRALIPGSMVVAFLGHAKGDTCQPVSEATGSYGGLRSYAVDELAAYSARLDGLAALRRTAGPRDGLDPAGLMEWLVAAAENPLTRREGTSREIFWAVKYLELITERPEIRDGEVTLELDTMPTEAQQVRLAAALLATRTMDFADLDLFRLVRHFDPETAALWLAKTLRSGAIPEDGDFLGRLKEFAETLDKQTADAFLNGARDRLRELSSDDLSPEAEKKRQLLRPALARNLFADLALLLEHRAN